ncbi:MAG: hypothetical protein ACE5F9_14200 [Phycisphaerae bacterium]
MRRRLTCLCALLALVFACIVACNHDRKIIDRHQQALQDDE